MKTILGTFSVLVLGLLGALVVPEKIESRKQSSLIPKSVPKLLIQFNARFNKPHQVRGLESIKTLQYKYIEIDNNPSLKSKFKLNSLPTIIYFEYGKEINRWEANVMMELPLKSSYFKNQKNLK